MTVRLTVTWTYVFSCSAPEEFFRLWENVSQETRDLIPPGGLPCDGGGVPGPWCSDCEFGKVEKYDD